MSALVLVVLISFQNQRGILQPGVHFLPYEFVQYIGADTPLRASLLLEKAAGGAQATIVVAGMNLTTIGLFARQCRATRSATPEAYQLAQQITAFLQVSRRKCLVLSGPAGRRMEGGEIDNGRHGNGNPFLLGSHRAFETLSFLAVDTVDGHTLLAVVVIGSDVGLLTQNPIHCGPTPLSAVFRRRCPIQSELLGNLTNRQVPAHIGVEDPLHDNGLGFLYFGMRRHTITAWNFHITERDVRRNNLSTTCAVEFATPVSFGNLRALELGHGSCDLVHQLRKRIVGCAALQENRLHAEPFQLIQDESL